jgi:hypothetical protein
MKRHPVHTLFPLLAAILLAGPSCLRQPAEEGSWQSLFNGTDLQGWEVKIAGLPPGEDPLETFRVEDGILKVCYDGYEHFGDRFGHLFYHRSFSHYILRVEYRFTGEQVPGGPAWAFRNNGIMFHAQAPATMALHQHFPISVEAQMLGGSGEGERPTGSVCTPGTRVSVGGRPVEAHCFSSDGPTLHGDDWVLMELVVLGDSLVHHIVQGDTVLTYGRLRYSGPMLREYPAYAPLEGQALRSGHIALQAESHPTEFRRIEIRELPQR